jgi:hypothetical protein
VSERAMQGEPHTFVHVKRAACVCMRVFMCVCVCVCVCSEHAQSVCVCVCMDEGRSEQRGQTSDMAIITRLGQKTRTDTQEPVPSVVTA